MYTYIEFMSDETISYEKIYNEQSDIDSDTTTRTASIMNVVVRILMVYQSIFNNKKEEQTLMQKIYANLIEERKDLEMLNMLRKIYDAGEEYSKFRWASSLYRQSKDHKKGVALCFAPLPSLMRSLVEKIRFETRFLFKEDYNESQWILNPYYLKTNIKDKKEHDLFIEYATSIAKFYKFFCCGFMDEYNKKYGELVDDQYKIYDKTIKENKTKFMEKKNMEKKNIEKNTEKKEEKTKSGKIIEPAKVIMYTSQTQTKSWNI